MAFKTASLIDRCKHRFWLKKMINEVETGSYTNQKSPWFPLGILGEKRFSMDIIHQGKYREKAGFVKELKGRL
ncbi:MAG: hypothetical protein NTZ18_02280 [Candidatus Komeilibacteria bacterium]|nr:hypothetical protein [Candidatus Komeilibacteria bacterium]